MFEYIWTKKAFEFYLKKKKWKIPFICENNMILNDSVYFIGRGMERSSAGNKFSEQGMDSSSREWCFDKWKSSSESSGDMFVSQVFFSVICEDWLFRFAVVFFFTGWLETKELECFS